MQSRMRRSVEMMILVVLRVNFVNNNKTNHSRSTKRTFRNYNKSGTQRVSYLVLYTFPCMTEQRMHSVEQFGWEFIIRGSIYMVHSGEIQRLKKPTTIRPYLISATPVTNLMQTHLGHRRRP